MSVTSDTPVAIERRQVVEAYLAAFEERQLGACVDQFAEDAVLRFGPATLGLGCFRGRDAIENWHAERFKAGARVARVEGIEVDDNQVRVRGVITSPRLTAVRIPDLRGSGTFVFDGSKFRELKLGLARGYRFHI